MASVQSVPYMAAYGNITKALERIKTASTPDRFTQDFLDAKIALRGGSARPVIPFLKRTGFLNSDGSPSELYVQFRNDSLAGTAAATALRKGYAALYEIHEYAHDLDDKELKDIVIQATGWDASSSNIKSALGSFKALRAYANFDKTSTKFSDLVNPTGASDNVYSPATEGREQSFGVGSESSGGIRLGYTINLNLPATTDIAVFNAIFKSLKDHLL